MFAKKLAVLAIALSPGICAGQTVTSKTPEPDLVAVFFYLEPAAQELKKLPVENWKTHVEGWSRNFVCVSGVGSPFRIAANSKTEFIFKIEHPEYARLFQFTVNVKKNQRQFELVKAGSRNRQWDPGIAINITKFGESSYKLTPQAPLGPGEYALFIGERTLFTASNIFTFAVGAK